MLHTHESFKVHFGGCEHVICKKHLYECKQLLVFSCRHSFEYLDRNIFHQTDHLQTPSDFENKNSSDKNLFASEFDLLLLLVYGRNICLMVLLIFQKSIFVEQALINSLKTDCTFDTFQRLVHKARLLNDIFMS